MKRPKLRITPLTALQNSWDNVSACKHWFTCDGLTNGRLVDSKGNVIINPQTGYEFVHDANIGAVYSTADANAAREELYSGSWTELPENEFCLIFYSGYVEDTQYSPTFERYMRLAVGDVAADNLGGIGLSDGDGGGGSAAHVLAKMDDTHYVASRSILSGTSAADAVYGTLGTTGHFFRYALYRPDTLTMESRIYRTDTGALLQENEEQYGLANPMPSIPFDTKFRMSGSKQTCFGVFHFTSVPADYLLAMNSMAAAARDGNKVVWPYWS